MATTYNDNNQVNAPKALDNKRGKFASGVWRPYNNVAEALASVTFRHVGLTVDILKDGVLTEYWWRDNTTDGGLIEKTSSGEITIDPTPTNGSDNAVASNGVFDALATKQDTLVSGTNIKTINGTAVLGSGDITISSGTIDAVPTDGSSNAVSSNGTFDALALKAPLASPTFTGTPASTTAAVDTNTTQIATTAYVVGQGYAKLASPTFTGVPLAPTASVDTNSTQIATTAFVVAGFQTLPRLGATFNGTLTFDKLYTSYNDYTVASNIVITIAASGKIQGTTEQVVLIGNGTNLPDFSACRLASGSPSFNNANGILNLVTFLYDGTRVWYTVTQ